MTIPMKRAYVRKDKSPEAKAVDFIEASREQNFERRLRDIELDIVSLRKQFDFMNRELNKQQKIYNQNFADMEESLKMSWSYRIRNFLGM